MSDDTSKDAKGTLISARLPDDLFLRLRLSSVRRKAAKIAPCTHKDIIRDALQDWLAREEQKAVSA